MNNNPIVKFALTILCSLLFLWGQVPAMASPAACASQPDRQCCRDGKMTCCSASPSSVPQTPVSATAPAGSQQQILPPVSTLVSLIFPAVETLSVSPVAAAFLQANDEPIFARHCARLI
ncbi:MAG: hypothetical protein WDM80_12385 [Limisphaerales bacterium]